MQVEYCLCGSIIISPRHSNILVWMNSLWWELVESIFPPDKKKSSPPCSCVCLWDEIRLSNVAILTRKWFDKQQLQVRGAVQQELREEKEGGGDVSGLSLLLSCWRKLTICTSNGTSQDWGIWQQRIGQRAYTVRTVRTQIDTSAERVGRKRGCLLQQNKQYCTIKTLYLKCISHTFNSSFMFF